MHNVMLYSSKASTNDPNGHTSLLIIKQRFIAYNKALHVQVHFI